MTVLAQFKSLICLVTLFGRLRRKWCTAACKVLKCWPAERAMICKEAAAVAEMSGT